MPLALALALAVWAAPVRVAVLGDLNGGADEAAFEMCLAAAARMCPDVVINVGDLIEGYTDDPAELGEEWDAVLATIGEGLPGIPTVLVPGNHDITYDEAEPVWVDRTGTAPERIEERCGVLFVVWDTSRMSGLDEDGLDRLGALLERVRPSDTAVLVTHQPFWMMSGVEADAAAELRRMVEDAGIEAAIGGHIHTYSFEEEGGTLFISMCTSGGDFGAEEVQAGWFHQVGWLTLGGDEAGFAVLDPRFVYPADLNTVAEENTRYLLETRMLDPRPLETALESAALTVNAMEDTERTALVRIDPEGWGLQPDSLAVTLAPGVSRTLYFSQNPGDAIYPTPLIGVEVPYGSRGKVARFEQRWPALRTLDAPEASVTVDGAAAEGEYPGRAETVFAGDDGAPSQLPLTAVRAAASGGRLCVHARMTTRGGLEEEAFGLVVSAGSVCWRVKVFPDGDADAISYSEEGLSGWETGWEAAATAGDGWWEAEIAIDLGSTGAGGFSVPAHIYRLSSGGLATWAWPLEFDEGTMGRIDLLYRLP